MEILLRGIKEGNEAQVKADMQRAFADPPEVTVEQSPEAGGTVGVVVLYQPNEIRDRQSVSSTIDAVLMRNNYVFCNITHRNADVGNASLDTPPLECGGGWHNEVLQT